MWDRTFLVCLTCAFLSLTSGNVIGIPQPDASVVFVPKSDSQQSILETNDDVKEILTPEPISIPEVKDESTLEADRVSRQFGFGASFGLGPGIGGGYGFDYGHGHGHYAPDYGHQHHHHHHGGYDHGHGGYGHGGYGHGGYGHGGYGHGGYDHGHGGYDHGHGGYDHGHGGYDHGGYGGHHHHHHGYGRGFIQEYTSTLPLYYYPSRPIFGFEPQPPLPFNGISQEPNPVAIGPPEPIPPLAPQSDILTQTNVIVPPALPQEIKPIAPEIVKVDLNENEKKDKIDNEEDEECICKKKKKVDTMAEDKLQENLLRRH